MSKINFKTGLLAEITKIIYRLFLSICQEINQQDRLDRITTFKDHAISNVDFEITMLKNDLERLEGDKYAVISRFNTLLEVNTLFGGEKGCNLLPTINISSLNVEVHPDDMSSPIMKGYCDGRHFFVLRIKNRDDDQAFCEFFYERYYTEGSWHMSGHNEITKTADTFLIKAGKIDKEPFNNLAGFIKNKGNEIYELV